MKGIVFAEFIEMVEQKFSTSVANRLLDESDLPSGGAYTAVGTYDHRELVSMVVKLSEISGLPIPVLIKTFGIYLFGRFYVLYRRFRGSDFGSGFPCHGRGHCPRRSLQALPGC